MFERMQDGIEYSRAYGDECLKCRSRDIGESNGRRFCKHCKKVGELTKAIEVAIALGNAKSGKADLLRVLAQAIYGDKR